MHWRFHTLGLFIGTLAFLSCDSGVGVDAPNRIPTAATDCTTEQPQLNYINAVLETKTLNPLAPMVDAVLFDGGAFRPIGQLLIALARQVDPNNLPMLVKNYEQGEGLARLSEPGFALLQYSDADNQQTPADNHGLWHFAGTLIQTCPAHDMIGMARSALQLPYEAEGTTETKWFEVLLDKLGVLLSDPELSALLARFELDENTLDTESTTETEEGQILLGRDAFVVLLNLIAGNLTSPDLDTAYFRTTIDELLLPQLEDTPDLRDKIADLMDVGFYGLESDDAFLSYLQSTVTCLLNEDNNNIFAHFVYDLITFSFIDFGETVDSADTITEDLAGPALLDTLEVTLDILFADDYLARDLLASVSGFLSPTHTPLWVPTLIQLQGDGIMADFSGIVAFFFNSCTPGAQ